MPAKSENQQTTARIALAAKKKGPAAVSKLKSPAKSMAKMSVPELEKFAKGKIKKESVKESITMQQPRMGQMQQQMPSHEHPGCEDNIGDIFVVLKPTPEDTPQKLVHSTNVFGMGQYDPSSIHGIYNNEEEANIVAEAACNELYKTMKALEEKKHTVINRLDKTIREFQKRVNRCMEAGDDGKAQHYLQKISELRNQHKVVEASRKEIEKPEEE